MNIFKFGIFLVVLAMLAGCAQQPRAVTPDANLVPPYKGQNQRLKPFTVRLRVSTNTGSPVLDDLNPRNDNCIRFPNTDPLRKGCIVAGEDEIVKVEFELVGSADWQFAEFQICSTTNTSVKPGFGSCGLSAEQAADWIVITDTGAALPGTTDGKVDISKLGNNVDNFDLLDLNLIQADYFYRVCAKTKNTNGPCVEGTNCVCNDPGGANTGRLN